MWDAADLTSALLERTGAHIGAGNIDAVAYAPDGDHLAVGMRAAHVAILGTALPLVVGMLLVGALFPGKMYPHGFAAGV